MRNNILKAYRYSTKVKTRSKYGRITEYWYHYTKKDATRFAKYLAAHEDYRGVKGLKITVQKIGYKEVIKIK